MLAGYDRNAETAAARTVPAPAGRARAGASTTERLRRLLCALLVALGLSVIAGWLLDIASLKSIHPRLSTMKFNTAAGFVAAGIGALLAGYNPKPARYAGALVGLLLFLLGSATLAEYGFGLHLGIDQAVVRDTGRLTGSGFPGRMSLLTAIAWTGIGIALVLLAMATSRAQVIAAHCLALVGGGVAMLAAAGYTFGAQAFWGIGSYTLIAAHTAAGLLIASAALLMTRAREGWLAPYVGSPAALSFLTRMIPVALGMPVLLGLIIMLGAGLGAYNAPYGFALFIPLTSIGMVVTALWAAGRERVAEQERLRYQRHLQLVVAELNHRVKNTLAIVQSFAHQSLKGSNSPAEAGAAFEGRLAALASAHKVLTEENWDKVGLIDLIGSSLHAHNDTGTRFAVEGPDLWVSPKTAITLAMTLHELATNSMKYGALSSPTGYVRVNWDIADGQFRLNWKDVDGPPCKAPERSGFGTRMLTRALATDLGGKASLEFEPDGVRYEVVAPARAEL